MEYEYLLLRSNIFRELSVADPELLPDGVTFRFDGDRALVRFTSGKATSGSHLSLRELRGTNCPMVKAAVAQMLSDLARFKRQGG
ncbi:MAG: hypothetical protein AB7E81_24130 [Hyphomicrobiaceae bacterium]